MPPAADHEPTTIDALRAAIAAQRARNAATEQALTEAKAHLELLHQAIATVPGIVWADDGAPDGLHFRITFVGGQGAEMLGYTLEEWQSDPDLWAKVLHPEDAERVKRRISGAAASPRAHLDEYRFVAKDGRVIWVEPRRRILKDPEGNPVGRCGVLLDVTARKSVERMREDLIARAGELSRRLDDLITSVPGVVWEIRMNPETQASAVTFISNHMTALTGYTPDECVDDPRFLLNIVHPDDRARAQEDAARANSSGVGVSQVRWVTKDGRAIWVENHMRILLDERGAPIGAYGVAMDINAQKLAEEERDRQKEEVIRAQAAALEELSTPLIPLSADVMVMPLVGGVDRARAERVIEALLHGISRARARFAIIDITGVPSVDESTADTLLRAARAVALLGAKVVLTGAHPEVARAFVALGADLSGVVTCGTLESGIAYATRRRR